MGRILYFQWHSFMNAGMERALQKLEIAYDTFFYTFTDWERMRSSAAGLRKS